MIVADTSGLLAYFNRDEPAHDAVKQAIESRDVSLAVSPYVIAELDNLLATRVGSDAEIAVLKELAGGAYVLSQFDASDLERASEVVSRYEDQQIGLTDASLVVLADRLGSRRILTLDRRHFEVLRPLSGGRFTIIP